MQAKLRQRAAARRQALSAEQPPSPAPEQPAPACAASPSSAKRPRHPKSAPLPGGPFPGMESAGCMLLVPKAAVWASGAIALPAVSVTTFDDTSERTTAFPGEPAQLLTATTSRSGGGKEAQARFLLAARVSFTSACRARLEKELVRMPFHACHWPDVAVFEICPSCRTIAQPDSGELFVMAFQLLWGAARTGNVPSIGMRVVPRLFCSRCWQKRTKALGKETAALLACSDAPVRAGQRWERVCASGRHASMQELQGVLFGRHCQSRVSRDGDGVVRSVNGVNVPLPPTSTGEARKVLEPAADRKPIDYQTPLLQDAYESFVVALCKAERVLGIRDDTHTPTSKTIMASHEFTLNQSVNVRHLQEKLRRFFRRHGDAFDRHWKEQSPKERLLDAYCHLQGMLATSRDMLKRQHEYALKVENYDEMVPPCPTLEQAGKVASGRKLNNRLKRRLRDSMEARFFLPELEIQRLFEEAPALMRLYSDPAQCNARDVRLISALLRSRPEAVPAVNDRVTWMSREGARAIVLLGTVQTRFDPVRHCTVLDGGGGGESAQNDDLEVLVGSEAYLPLSAPLQDRFVIVSNYYDGKLYPAGQRAPAVGSPEYTEPEAPSRLCSAAGRIYDRWLEHGVVVEAAAYIQAGIKQERILRFFARWLRDWCAERRDEDGWDVSFEEQIQCFRCAKKGGVNGVKLLKCGKCGRTRYCSRECQKQDWKRHKRVDCVGTDGRLIDKVLGDA